MFIHSHSEGLGLFPVFLLLRIKLLGTFIHAILNDTIFFLNIKRDISLIFIQWIHNNLLKHPLHLYL